MPRRRTPPRKQSFRPLPVQHRVETGPDGHDYEVRPVAAARPVLLADDRDRALARFVDERDTAPLRLGQPRNVHRHSLRLELFTRTPPDYDVTDRAKAFSWLKARGDEVATGIFFVDESVDDLHEASRTPRTPLARLPYEKLCPGAAELARLQEEFR